MIVSPAVGHDALAVIPEDNFPAVKADVTAVTESFQRTIAPLIGQEAVAVLIHPQFRHFLLHPFGIDINVFPHDFAGTGSFEKVILPGMSVGSGPRCVAVGQRMFAQRTLPDGRHILVQFRTEGGAESPVGIHPAVVVHQHTGIKAQLSLNRIDERSPRCLRTGHHDP